MRFKVAFYVFAALVVTTLASSNTMNAENNSQTLTAKTQKFENTTTGRMTENSNTRPFLFKAKVAAYLTVSSLSVGVSFPKDVSHYT